MRPTERFLEFQDSWGRKYPAIVKLWSDAVRVGPSTFFVCWWYRRHASLTCVKRGRM
jgi:hypothetical protein